MQIIRGNWLPISAILIIVAMTLAASTTDRQSSATDFDPDYPIGTPPILGGTGYVTETSTGWHNAQDWSIYNTDYSGYHPGEDWNYGTGTADVGKPVYAIAAGTVVDTRDALFNDKSGYGSGIAIEHTLPSGEKIYSVYEHIDIASGLSIGDPVWQGDRIGSIADTSKLSPHLHFEIRTKQVDTEDWYPNDNGYGYYASEEKLRADGFTVDPSDFIDSHRSPGGSVDAGTASQVTLTLHVHDGNADGPIIPGATVEGQDGAGNSFQKTTDSNGYVTIEGDSGTWSFSASANGYETNNWDQDITETDRKDAFLLKEQQPSESSVVGKWDVQTEIECKCPILGEIYRTDSRDHSIIEFHKDGTITVSVLESQYLKYPSAEAEKGHYNGVWVENEQNKAVLNTAVSVGEWVQNGDLIHIQYDPSPKQTDDDNTAWESDGETWDGKIDGDTMSGTGSSLLHCYSPSADNGNPLSYDCSFSTHWSASRVNTQL